MAKYHFWCLINNNSIIIFKDIVVFSFLYKDNVFVFVYNLTLLFIVSLVSKGRLFLLYTLLDGFEILQEISIVI